MKKFKIKIIYNGNGNVEFYTEAKDIEKLRKSYIKEMKQDYIIVENKNEGKSVILLKNNISRIECTEMIGE